jgi:hypothetical protein
MLCFFSFKEHIYWTMCNVWLKKISLKSRCRFYYSILLLLFYLTQFLLSISLLRSHYQIEMYGTLQYYAKYFIFLEPLFFLRNFVVLSMQKVAKNFEFKFCIFCILTLPQRSDSSPSKIQIQIIALVENA